MLSNLPDHALLNVCLATGVLSGKDLAALEATARRFRLRSAELKSSRQAATLPEFAAEELLAQHSEGWRLAPRPGDSWKCLFHLADDRLLRCRAPVVAAGQAHSLACRAGKLFAFGANDCLQLGLKSSAEVVARAGEEYADDFETSPMRVEMGRGDHVVCVAAGSAHSAAVSSAGKLWTWGDAEDGKLGFVKSTGNIDRLMNKAVGMPRLVCGFAPGVRVVQVACGDDHTACVSATGTAFAWGINDGRLGRGPPPPDDDVSEWTVSEEFLRPGLVCGVGSHRVVAVQCGESQTSLITAEGKLLMCGVVIVTKAPEIEEESPDLYQNLWIPEQIEFPAGIEVRQMSFGPETRCAAVSWCGSVFVWGQWDILETGLIFAPLKLEALLTAGFADEGESRARRARRTLLEPSLLNMARNAASVHCGDEHAVVVTEDGFLWSWGLNADGQSSLSHSYAWTDREAIPAMEVQVPHQVQWFTDEPPHPVLGPHWGSVPTLSKIGVDAKVVHGCCGALHTVTVLEDAKGEAAVYTFGRTQYGRCGRTEHPDRVGGITDESVAKWKLLGQMLARRVPINEDDE